MIWVFWPNVEMRWLGPRFTAGEEAPGSWVKGLWPLACGYRVRGLCPYSLGQIINPLKGWSGDFEPF